MLTFLTLSCFGCHESTSPNQTNVTLRTNMGVTDGSLLVKHTGFPAYDTFEFKENDSVLLQGGAPQVDTSFYVKGLKPNQAYSFEAVVLESGHQIFSSGVVNATTLDTTSNDFTWKFDTLGGASSSEIRAVAILNDTCAFAVGDAYVRDSTGGVDINPYNVARWDGKTWTLTKVGHPLLGSTSTEEFTSMYAFSPNDVWVAGGGGEAFHWDGISWTDVSTVNTVFGGHSLGLYGTDYSNMYMIGTSGSMAHFDGASWHWVETGTALDIQDIWGATDPLTGKLTILAVAGNYYSSNDRKIFSICGTQLTSISDSGISWALDCVWFAPGKRYVVAGDGVYEKQPFLTEPEWTVDSFTRFSTNAVRGTDVNNIFIAGAYGDICHFNGIRWTSLDAQTRSSGSYEAVAARDRIVIASGYLGGSQAIIAVGRRKFNP